MSSKKNIFWGIVLVLGAAALLVHKLGYLQGIGFWPIVLNVFLVAVLIKAVIRGRGGTILFSVVLLIIVNDRLG